MAAIPMSGIEAVVFDLFGTLVYEFPRADWEGWLETSAAILEADVDAFKAAWQATGIERQFCPYDSRRTLPSRLVLPRSWHGY